MNRKEALSLDLAFYEGRQCKYGHGNLRRTTDRHCVECQRNHSKSEKAKMVTSMWREANRERAREHSKNHDRKRAKSKAVYDRERRDADPDYFRQKAKEWAENNSAAVRERNARRRAKQRLACPVWLTPDHHFEINNVYSKCPTGYEVDHIVPLNGKSVCGLHVPWNLQYLTEKENAIKGNHWWPNDWKGN